MGCRCPALQCKYANTAWAVFVAYFAVLLPMGIIVGIDFINVKWKTIRRTRHEGLFYMLASIVCSCYLMYFIHLQMCIENYTEAGAAITAALYYIFHMFCTIWGLLQLDAFKRWNVKALRVLRKLGHKGEPDRYANQILLYPGLEEVIEREMPVNNSLIDNTFTDSVLPVRLNFKNLIKYRSRNPTEVLRFEDFFECTEPAKCAVQWTVVFLSAFGVGWVRETARISNPQFGSFIDGFPEYHLSLLASRKIGILVSLHATVSEDIGRVSLLPLDHTFFKNCMSSQEETYEVPKNSALPFNMRGLPKEYNLSVASFAQSIQDSIFGPTNQREGVNAISPHQIACFAKIMDGMDGEEPQGTEPTGTQHVWLKMFFKSWLKPSSPTVEQVQRENTEPIEPDVLALRRMDLYDQRRQRFIRQIGYHTYEGEDDVTKRIPIQKVALYEVLWPNAYPGYNFLQVSLHTDNWLSLEIGERLSAIPVLPPVGAKYDPRNSNSEFVRKFLAIGYAGFATDINAEAMRRVTFFGCAMDIVRFSLSQGALYQNMSHIQLGNGLVTLPVSEQLCSWLGTHCEQLKKSVPPGGSVPWKPVLIDDQVRSIHMRMLWEMQCALHRRTTDQSLLIMLCILGFPGLKLHYIENRSDSTQTYIEIRVVCAPQENIFLNLCVRHTMKRAYLQFGNIENFSWQEWKTAFLFRMKGMRGYQGVTQQGSPSPGWPPFFDISFDFSKPPISGGSSPTYGTMRAPHLP